MAAILYLTLALSVCGCLAASTAIFLTLRVRERVVEPIEIRRQVMEFDQLLTEHEEKLRAYYARQRKRDKTLTDALADGSLPDVSDVIGPALVAEVDHKDVIRQEARRRGLI